MEILANIPVELNLEQLLKQLHISPDSDDVGALQELLDRVRPLINPKAVFALRYVEQRGANTVDIGDVVFTSRVLRVNLENVHRVFPFIATCGTELEHVPEVEGDPLREYWLDQIKINALSAASKHLREHIDRRYKPGKMSSMSPGSLEDWPITQQKELFSVFGDVKGKIGVKLSSSYLMHPLKSLSGIFFPTEISFESCRLCPREVCPSRSAPYDPQAWERYAER